MRKRDIAAGVAAFGITFAVATCALLGWLWFIGRL